MFPPSARAIVSAKKGTLYQGVHFVTDLAGYNNGNTRYSWNYRTNDGVFSDLSTYCDTSYNEPSCGCCGQDPYPPYDCYSCEATNTGTQTVTLTYYNGLTTGGYYHSSGTNKNTGWLYLRQRHEGSTWNYSANNCTYNDCTGGYSSTMDYIIASNSTALEGGGQKDLGSIGIKYDGTLWAWGGSKYLQYRGWGGTYGNGYKLSPFQLGSSSWEAISVGTNQTETVLAVASPAGGGALWGWGYGGYGVLGKNNTTSYSSPVQIGADTDWIYVHTNGETTWAIKNDNSLYAWGYNGYGQIGDGTSTNRSSPVQIGTGTNWKQLSSNGQHVIALKTDGTIWCWGYGATGQVGQNSISSRSSPVQIGTATDWIAIYGGGSSSWAIKSDNTVWGWGNAAYYGRSPGSASSSPVQLGGGSASFANFMLEPSGGDNAHLITKDKNEIRAYYSGGTNYYSYGNLAGPYYDVTSLYPEAKNALIDNNAGIAMSLRTGTA